MIVRKVAILVTAILTVVALIVFMNASGKGGRYYAASQYREMMAEARQDFEEAFEVREIRGVDGAIEDVEDPFVEEDQLSGLLGSRDDVIQSLREELYNSGKIAIVCGQPWESVSRSTDTPDPVVFIFN